MKKKVYNGAYEAKKAIKEATGLPVDYCNEGFIVLCSTVTEKKKIRSLYFNTKISNKGVIIFAETETYNGHTIKSVTIEMIHNLDKKTELENFCGPNFPVFRIEGEFFIGSKDDLINQFLQENPSSKFRTWLIDNGKRFKMVKY